MGGGRVGGGGGVGVGVGGGGVGGGVVVVVVGVVVVVVGGGGGGGGGVGGGGGGGGGWGGGGGETGVCVHDLPLTHRKTFDTIFTIAFCWPPYLLSPTSLHPPVPSGAAARK